MRVIAPDILVKMISHYDYKSKDGERKIGTRIGLENPNPTQPGDVILDLPIDPSYASQMHFDNEGRRNEFKNKRFDVTFLVNFFQGTPRLSVVELRPQGK